MRILSKFKDYYDFVVSEPDNKKMFIRETTVFQPENSRKLKSNYGNTMQLDSKKIELGFLSLLAFCDKLYQYFQYENVIYWNYEDIPENVIKAITPKSKWWGRDNYENSYWGWGRNEFNDMLHYKKLGWIVDRHSKEPIKSKLNKEFDTPIVFINNPNYTTITLNPKLTDLGFNKILSPTEAYQDIYNWIPYKEPETPSSPDDMGRYEAKGFDKKSSFRPNMK